MLVTDKICRQYKLVLDMPFLQNKDIAVEQLLSAALNGEPGALNKRFSFIRNKFACIILGNVLLGEA